LFSKLQNLLPQHALSRFAGFMANCRVRWIKNRLIQYFVWRYPVNLQEAINPDPYQYENFNDFFTRALKPEVRPISKALNVLVSPADGEISQLGPIENGRIIQAKKHHFSVQDLLGGDPKQALSFLQGSFMTVYLAPKDYHRVHMPLDGEVTDMIYIPGQLFSVNHKTTDKISNLFARNERVVVFFNTSVGRVAMVLVGAMIVGSIETVWAGTITGSRKQQDLNLGERERLSIQKWHYDIPIHYRRGEEMGRFKLGSTVIVLFEENKVLWDSGLTSTSQVRLGQRLGELKPGQS